MAELSGEEKKVDLLAVLTRGLRVAESRVTRSRCVSVVITDLGSVGTYYIHVPVWKSASSRIGRANCRNLGSWLTCYLGVDLIGFVMALASARCAVSSCIT